MINLHGFIIDDFFYLIEYLVLHLILVFTFLEYLILFKRILDLTNIHYAKSITILNNLVNGATYIQPPVIVIEYDELSTSDIGKGTIVEVRRQLNK